MTNFATLLLNHYDLHARDLPWRHDYSPYKVWVSEIMLQQTTVATVIPYYKRFLNKFPNIHTLAEADIDEIYMLWQGLGYYSRARNLHKCAKIITAEYSGEFPKTEQELLKLPGIGPYTAAAINAIAFNNPSTVVDGNVERIISRIHEVQTPLPEAKKEIKHLAEQLTPQKRCRDYASAIMDLGATICTPKNPKCEICPIQKLCSAYKNRLTEKYPLKSPKKKKRVEEGNVYLIVDREVKIFLRKREAPGLLHGLWELPTDGWNGQKQLKNPLKEITNIDELNVKHEEIGVINHEFTHISLKLNVIKISLNNNLSTFYNTDKTPPLPTLFKKVINML